MNARNWTLRAQLVSLVIMLLLVLSAVLFTLLPQRMSNQSLKLVSSQADGVVVALQAAVGAGVEFEQAAQLETQLNELREPLNMNYARIYKADNSLLVATDATAPKTLSVASSGGIEKQELDGILHVRSPFESNGIEATLVLGFSLDRLEQQRRQNQVTVAWISALLVLLGAVATLGIGTVLSRPIQEMSVIAGQIAEGRIGDAERSLAEIRRVIGDGQQTSEVNQLVVSFGAMVGSLKETVITLTSSSGSLGQARDILSELAAAQSETITRQAASLQETQVTVQEIKQTSEVATQKADAVLAAAVRADEIGKSGSAAIEQSLGGLSDIRNQVEDIAVKIGELSERTDQIGGITQTVKDLADQSNMLALNATIEAVRSGEHGKAFAVVAREIRSLADQSVQATGRVREILEDITDATSDAVHISEAGRGRVETSLVQLNESGENLRQLSDIVRSNSSAARQIAAAVSQQNAGVTQIVSALASLSEMMEDAVSRVEETKRAAMTLSTISQEVSAVADQYRL